MSDKISIPDGSTWNATDVANTINWITQILTGKIKISFSNMTGTAEPKLQAGTIIEVNGVLYSASAEKSNTGWSGIANSTQAYLYAVITSDNIVPTWSTTAPTWSDAKNGWYESGTTKKCMLTCYKDGSGDYTQKSRMLPYGENQFHGDQTIYGDVDVVGDTEHTGGLTLTGALKPHSSPTEGSESIAALGTWVPPRGAYLFYLAEQGGASTPPIYIQAYINGDWQDIFRPDDTSLSQGCSSGKFVFCDGTNIRLRNSYVTTAITARYLRF